MSETIEELKAKIAVYENNSAAKLYYALTRKMNEMADMLNKSNLSNLDLTDSKDKTFERLKIIWNDASGIATAVKALGDTAGITGDEEKDVRRQRTTPESIAESLGDNKSIDV